LGSGAVVFRAVRRLWVTVLVGLFGLVLGLIIGFAVGLREKLGDSGWLEAVGTWVGAGVTLLAVILGAVAYLSEEFARRRVQRRQEDAERAEQQRLQGAADRVFCHIYASGTDFVPEQARLALHAIEIEVENRSDSVVTDVACEVRNGFEWAGWIDKPIQSGETASEKFPASEKFAPADVQLRGVSTLDLLGTAVFTFSLYGHRWSRRCGHSPAIWLS
jgi:hypothetical protein